MKDSIYKYPLFYAVALHLLIFSLLFLKFAHVHHYAVSSNSSVKIINAEAVSQHAVEQRLAAIKAQQEAKRMAHLRYLQQLRAAKLAAQRREILQQQKLARVKAEKIAHAKAIRLAHLRVLHQQKLHQQHIVAAKAMRQKRVHLAVLAATQAKLQQQKKLVHAKQQVAAQQLLQQQIAQEQKQMAAAQAAKIQSVVDQYKALIVQAISERWIVPSNLAQGISCQLLLNLAPGGAVLNVSVVTSSGNPVLDRSAQTAVWKASPLPVPKDSSMFDRFRSIRLTVRPQVG
ncbi:MAG: cell envelope integrity protein TolA [Gammaproteobacteria bacterium]|nr:cell envelope integrity protein TolA [Gammaproteobacteria bacterium]